MYSSNLNFFSFSLLNGFRMPLLLKEGKLKCSTFPLHMEKLQWGLPGIGRYVEYEPTIMRRCLHS
jgi:hypothetical protein